MVEHERQDAQENQQTQVTRQVGETEESTASPARTRRKPLIDWRAVKDQFLGVLAGIVRWVGLIFALVLVVHIIFTVAGAEPDNSIVEFVSGVAPALTLGFEDLFIFDGNGENGNGENLTVLVNFGIAAVFWLLVSSIGSNLIRRLGGLPS